MRCRCPGLGTGVLLWRQSRMPAIGNAPTRSTAKCWGRGATRAGTLLIVATGLLQAPLTSWAQWSRRAVSLVRAGGPCAAGGTCVALIRGTERTRTGYGGAAVRFTR